MFVTCTCSDHSNHFFAATIVMQCRSLSSMSGSNTRFGEEMYIASMHVLGKEDTTKLQ